MDIEEAWDNFRSKSFQKASVQEQLDTLAAAINEIKTDTSRTAEIVPQIMGDNSAIDAANAAAGPNMPGAAPMDDMMGGMGGEDMSATDEQMPPEGGDMEADMGADMGEDMGAEAPVQRTCHLPTWAVMREWSPPWKAEMSTRENPRTTTCPTRTSTSS